MVGVINLRNLHFLSVILIVSLILSFSCNLYKGSGNNGNSKSINENSPPIADAEVPVKVFLGQVTMVDGSASSDSDGDELNYTWVFTEFPPNSSLNNFNIPDNTNSRFSFTPDSMGTYKLILSVNDGVESDSISISITVKDSLKGEVEIGIH